MNSNLNGALAEIIKVSVSYYFLGTYNSSIFNVRLSIEKDATACETLKLRSFFRQFSRERVPDLYYETLRKGRQDFGASLASHGFESSSASTPIFHRLSWCFIACVNEGRLADRSARSAGSSMMSKS